MDTKQNVYSRLPLMALIMMVITASGCTNMIANMAANSVGLLDTDVEVKKLNFPGKEVYFLEMKHLGKQAFYANVKFKVKEFEDKGFISYVESINYLDTTKRINDTMALKKLRFLTSMDFTIKYSMVDNPILKTMIEKNSLVDQPAYSVLGLNKLQRVDLLYTDLVNLYEANHGFFVLDSCNLASPLGKPMICGTASRTMRKQFREDIVFGEREKHIINYLDSSADKKILLIYGKAHYDGLKKKLAERKKAKG